MMVRALAARVASAEARAALAIGCRRGRAVALRCRRGSRSKNGGVFACGNDDIVSVSIYGFVSGSDRRRNSKTKRGCQVVRHFAELSLHPTACITAYQVAMACQLFGTRLLTSAEWLVAGRNGLVICNRRRYKSNPAWRFGASGTRDWSASP